MLELPSSLTAHQQGLRRLPAVEVMLYPERFEIPVLRLAADTVGSETEYPHDAVFAPDGTFVQVANRNGNLDVRLDFGSWTTISSSPDAGDPVAIAQNGTEITILCGEGTALVRYHSSDNGSTWSSASTIVSEASDITAVALAARESNGNLTAFYVLNSTSTVKRIRRSSGTWAGSGTTWTKTADWSSINGIAAVYDFGAFPVLVTGIAATTLKPTVAAYVMGDGGSVPSNIWSGPELVLQADAAADITYANPHVTAISSRPFGTFTADYTGDVAYTGRIYLTHGNDANGLLTWREPAPLPFTGAHGAAIAHNDALATYVATLSEMHSGPVEDDVDLSGTLTDCSWRMTPNSLKARLAFAFPPGSVPETLRTGNGIRLRHGYRSGTSGAEQYGLGIYLAIERVTTTIAGGRMTVTVEAVGPWETLDNWRSPQAWTAPALTRGGIFEYIAGRAGLSVSLLSGDWAPTDAWTNESPAFAIAAGESGGSVLQRLIQPTGDFLRATAGRFQTLSFAEDQDTGYDYGTSHAIVAASTIEQAAPNWFRIQGPDRHADAFNEHEANTVGPRFLNLRQLSSNTDELAEEAAAAALRRVRVLTPRARITIPADVGVELFDPVTVTFDALQLSSAEYRVIEIDFAYRAGRGPDATMTHTLTLGEK